MPELGRDLVRGMLHTLVSLVSLWPDIFTRFILLGDAWAWTGLEGDQPRLWIGVADLCQASRAGRAGRESAVQADYCTHVLAASAMWKCIPENRAVAGPAWLT